MKGKRVLQWIVLTALLLMMSISVSAAEEPVIYNTYIEGNQLHLYVGNAADAEGVSCQIGNTKCEDTSLQTEIPIETYILADNSLSIDEKYHETIHQILQKLVETISEQENITIATFDTELHYLLQNSTDPETLRQTVDGISYENQYTKVTDAVYTLCKDLENVPFDGMRRIILISDGTEDATVGYTRQELLNKLENLSYPVYTVGCTYKDNANKLEEMFSFSRLTDAEAFWLDEVSDAETIVSTMNSCKSVVRVCISIPDSLGDGASKGIKLDFQTEEGVNTVSTTVVMPFLDAGSQTETTVAAETSTPESAEVSADGVSETEETVITESATEAETVVAESAAEAESVITESATEAETVIAESVTEVESVIAKSATEAETVISESDTEAESVITESVTEAKTVIVEPVKAEESGRVGSGEEPETVEKINNEELTETPVPTEVPIPTELPAPTEILTPTESPTPTEASTPEPTTQMDDASESEISAENMEVQESEKDESEDGATDTKKIPLLIVLIILPVVFFLRKRKKSRNAGGSHKSGKSSEAGSDADDGITQMKRTEETRFKNDGDFGVGRRETEYTRNIANDSETRFVTDMSEDKTQLMGDGTWYNAEDMPMDFINIRLTDMRNPTRVTEVPLSESVSVGRGANVNQIVFEYDKSVSFTHCELFRRNGRIYVRDLNSTNGTWVNDQRVEDEQELYSGTVLKMGRLELIFEIVEPGE